MTFNSSVLIRDIGFRSGRSGGYVEVELSQRCAGRKVENAVLQGDVVGRGDFEGSVNDRQQLSDGSSVEAQAQLTSGGTWQPLGLPTRPCPTTTLGLLHLLQVANNMLILIFL